MHQYAQKSSHNRVALYARVSSNEQVQGYSIQAQLRACHDWAQKHGYKIVKEYLDEGYSASRNLEKREAFKEMLADAASKNPLFDIIIVHKLDRFSRDSLESVTARAILKRQKITLASVQEPMVGKDSTEDAFFEHILVGMAEFYSKNLSREIRKGLLERARQGHLVFRPPYGYKREVIGRQEGHKRTRIISRPVIDDKAAPIVRRIFELFEQGAGYKSIALTLNGEGYRSEPGKKFRSSHIARVLANKAYLGLLEYNFRQDRGSREPLTIPGFYPPIIDESLFNRVQEKLKETASYWQNAHAHTTEYLLSRLVICGACGHHYVGTSAKGGKFHYYSCQTYLRKGRDACSAPLLNKEKLEKAVLDQIQRHILSEQNVRRYIELVIEQAQRSRQEPSPEERAINLAIQDAESRLRRWEEALERGLLSLEDTAHRIRELRVEREQLLKRKAAVEEKSRSMAKIVPIPTLLMDAYIREMQARLYDKKIGYKKEFLRDVLKEVRVKGSEVILTYKLPLKPLTFGQKASKKEFFTVLQMVVAAGLEPPTY